MKDRAYGRVLSFSSMSWRGNFGQVNYVAAKAGVVGFTRGFALEGARHGVTANAIAPGLIETPMLASMNAPARDKLVAKVPLRSTGKPEDIAAAAAFLCSSEAGYITGVVLDVDGASVSDLQSARTCRIPGIRRGRYQCPTHQIKTTFMNWTEDPDDSRN